MGSQSTILPESFKPTLVQERILRLDEKRRTSGEEFDHITKRKKEKQLYAIGKKDIQMEEVNRGGGSIELLN